MINATNLRNSTIFVLSNMPYKVLKYEHIKMARGGAVVKVKTRDLINGVIKEMTFGNNDKVEEANVYNKNMQYLYSDADNLYFMDNSDYSQISIGRDQVGEDAGFLIEGKEFQVTFFGDKPMAVVLPVSMFYRVDAAPPAVRGNTAVSATKEIVLENGLRLEAPQFIKKGDTIKVNTSTGEYVSRGS